MKYGSVKARLSRIATALAAIGLPFFIQGCGETLPTVHLLKLEPSVKAFATHVQPILTKECSRCHANPPSDSGVPDFAKLDPNEAYEIILARELVSFGAIETSRLAVKGGIQHGEAFGLCQNCTVDLRAKIIEGLQKWFAESKPAGTQQITGIQTLHIPVPSTLPSGAPDNVGQFTTLNFTLSHLGPEFANTQFQVDIQRFGDNSSYRLRKPRLITGATAIRVAKIEALFNGAFDPNTSEWQLIDQVVNAASAPVLTGDYLIAEDPTPGNDTIGIRFGILEAGTPVACSAEKLAAIETTIRPTLTSTCFTCHRGTNALATSRFNMNVADAELCAQMLMRTFKIDPPSSVLVTFPFDQEGGHPAGVNIANKNAFIDWIGVQ